MNTINYENDFSVLKQKYQALEAQNELIVSELQDTIKCFNRQRQYLNCLYNINIILSDIESDIIDVFQYIINELKSGIYSENTLVQIETDEYKTDDFEVTDDFSILSEKILINNNNWGEIKIAFPAVLASDFLFNRNNEIGFLRLISSSIGFYLEKRYKYISVITEKETQYKNIFQNKHSIMFLLDPETGEIKDVNQAACDFYGWTYQEMCSKKIFDINPISELDMKAEMEKARQEKRSYFNFTHRLANGELRDVEVYSGPIIFNNKNLLYSIIHDITDRKNMEFKILRSEEKYRNIVESINDVVYEITKDGFITFVSPSVFKVLGYTEDEVLGKNIISYIHEEDRPMIIQRLNSINVKDYLFLEYRYVKKDGSTGWVRSSTNAITKEGVIIGGRGTLTDITERKNIEEALKISEDKFSKAFKTSPYASTITTLDGKIIEVNEAFTTISGYTKDEAINDSAIGLNLWVDLEERKKVLFELNERKEIVGKECQFRKKNGENIIAIFSASIIYIENIPYILSSINDITQRKKAEKALQESEALYHSIIYSSPDSIIITDTDGVIRFVTNKSLTMFGYDSFDDILNRNIFEFLTKDSIVKAQTEIARMFEGITGIPTEYQAIKSTGDIFDIEANGDIIRDFYNNPSKFVFVVRDITDRVLAKNMLIEDQKIFRILNDLMSDYIFKLSHQEDGNFKMSIIAGNYQKATGRLLEDIYTPSDWYKAIHPDDLSVLNANFKQVLEQKKPVILECRSFTEDGKLRWLEVIASPETDNQTQNINCIYGSVKNITEKKLSMQNLMESEQKYANLIENIHAGVVVHSPDTSILFCNTEASVLLGLTQNQLKGKVAIDPDWFFMDDKGIKLSLEEYPVVKVVSSKTPLLNQIYGINRPATNDIVWVQVNAYPEFTDEGLLKQVVVTFYNITEIIEAEKSIRVSEEKYRNLFENVQDVYYESTLDGKIIEISPSISALSKGMYNRNEMINKSLIELYANPEERIIFINEILEKGKVSDYELRFKVKDGSVKYLSLSSNISYNNEGKPEKIFGSLRDITERKLIENALRESEKRFRNLINSQTNFLIRTDLEGRLTYWNNKFEEEFGWVYEEEGLNNGIALKSILLHHHQLVFETVNQCMKYPDKIYKIELDKPARDGSVRTTLWEFNALTDENNNPCEIQCTGIDITDRKRMEMELRDSNERASVIMNSIDAFVYIADMQTHELIFVNEFGKKAWGEDITGKKCFSSLQGLNHPCDFCTNNKLLTADGKPKDVYQWEYQNKVNNRWYEIQDRAIYWTDGRVVRLEIAIDITDRKLSALKILESEEKFRLITEQTNDFIAIVDDTGVITYASSSSMPIFLLSPEEMNGRNFIEFVDENEITKAISVFNDMLNNIEIIENTEFRMKRADGTLFFGEINGSKFQSETQTGVFVAIRDITERKNAEIALSKSEERYRFITERSTDLIFVLRLKPEMGFEYVSPSSERITGYTPEDHYNDPMLGMKLVHPDDLHLLKSLQDGVINEEAITLRWIKKDGSTIWTESKNIPIYDVNGELVAIQGKAIDVTERKQSEQIIQTRLRLNEYAQTHSRNEIQQKLLDELELLTTSSIGFFHSVNDDQKSLTLQCWSTNTLENMCKAEGQGQHYGLDKAGVWTDCIQQRKAVIHNDYKSLTHKKGLPQGHAEVIRELVVPVFRNEKIVAIIGIGNKPTNYNETEIEMVSLLADLAWDITERKGSEEDLLKLSLAVEQSPVIIYITNLDGTISYANPRATDVSGYSNKELIGKNPRIFSSGEKPKEAYLELWHTISSGKEWKGEFHNKKKNGELYWVMASISPVINSNGVISHYIAIEEDITDRKFAEEKLKQKEISLNYSQEMAKMGSWEYDLITNKIKWSDNYYRLLGLQPDSKEISIDFFNSYIYPDDKHLTDLKLQEIIKYKKDISYDLRFIMPDGQLKWIQNNIVPEFDGDTLVTLKGVNIDITEKKLAEDKISNQNEQLNAIISAMPDLIFIIDKEGTYTDFFTSNLENLIIPVDKIIGTNIKSVFDEETATMHIQKIEECIRYKKLVTYEYEVSIDNKILYFDARLASLGTDKVLTSVRDITDRKEKETNLRKLSQAIEQSPVTIVITDINGRVEYVNPAFETTTGYSFEEVKGKTTEILKSGKMDESVYKELWENIPNGKEWHGEWINKRKNGELYWEDVSITPVFSESGEIINYLAVKQDITQKKESEKQILELNENLERKVQERTNELAQTNFILKKEIDNRILADISLEIEKQRLASIIEGTNVGTWEWNVKTGENIVNERWAEIFGYSLDELLPVSIDSWINFIHPDDKNKTIELIKKHFSGEFDYFDSEFRMKNKNGNWIWVLDRGKISKWDTDGKPLLMSGTLQDITKRKMAEEELQWNKSLLELMSNSSPLGFFVVDNRTDDILYFNNRFCQIWGIEHIADQMRRGELKNNDIIPYCLPVLADIPAFAESCKPLQEESNRIVLEDEIAFTENRTVRRFSTQIRSVDDEYYGRFYIFEDITERRNIEQAIKESEKKHASMISNISDVIGIMSADGIMKYKSPNIERYFGWKPEDLVDADGSITIHPDDLERIQTEFYHLFQADNSSKTVEYRYKCKDGSFKPIELTATNLINDPVINGVLLNYHDTTERKRIEDALRESEKRFSLFMDYLPAIVFLKDHEGRTLFVNKYMEEAFGASEWMGKTMLEVFPDNLGEKLLYDDMKSLEIGYQKIEESLFQLDGRLHSYETQKFVINRQGQPPLLGGISLDITDRKQAEQIIEQTRKNYETFFNTIDDFLFVLDEKGNIIHTNKTVNERLEYSNEELFGKSVLLVHPEERREEAGRIVGEMLAGTADFCPVPLLTKSGNYLPVETRVKQGFWNGNAVIFGVTKDVSKLQLSEQKFSKAFQSNSALMAISYFENGIFIDINDSFIKTLGYSREEVICKTAEELKLFPDSKFRKSIIDSINNHNPIREVEMEAIKKDGSSIFGLFSADLIYIGKDSCLLTVMVDITERKTIEKALKESEARWNFALEGSASGVWDWNIQTGTVYVSMQWKKLLGYNENDAEVAHPVFETWKSRVHPDDIKKSLVYLNKHLKGNTSVYIHEYRMMRKDGSYIWVLDRGKIIEKDENKNPLRVIGTITDISDRKKFEKTLKQSIEREKELNDLKSRFVSMASHEFRTPLASILMYSDILISYWEKMDTIQIFDNLKVIKDQVSHLTAVVADVMQISKIQEGRVNFNPQKTDIISLCKNTLLTFNSDIKLVNKINFKSDIKEAIVKIDIRLIQQVLNNLISNAIKYNDNNPVISFKITANETALHISIKDNGIGIPEEDMKHLFEAFFRAKNVKNIQGNGLGLNIVKEAMKLHGGSVIVESKVKKGSVFTLIFPMKIIVSCK